VVSEHPRRGALGWRLDPITVGIDIGGSKLLAGAVDAHGQVLEKVRRETPTKSPRAVEDAIVETVRDLAERHPVAAVGIGAAGFVDTARASVLFSPHLAWRNEPLRDAVWARLRLPVVVDNDANAAAWAESRFGAAVGRRHVLCITLGTGIGGALLFDGRVFRGANGMAGEFGHMQAVPGGHRCECGNRGCWEQYASGNALVRDARELVQADSPGRPPSPGCRRRRRDPADRAAGDRGRPRRRPRRGRADQRGGQLAGHRAGRADRRLRPRRHHRGRRRLRGRRPAAGADAGVVRPDADRPRLPHLTADRGRLPRPRCGLRRRRGPGPFGRP
jgi:hypothetical protein